jgi:hypothetical protein
MAFNINEMKAQLVGGGAKPTLFQVVITNPINSNADVKVPFMVHATTLPPSQLGSFEVPYMGRKIQLAGERTFPEWSVSVFNDEDFSIRNSIENWMNVINSHTGNLRLTGTASPAEYKSQAIVTQFSKTGLAIREYKFEGLFPTLLGDIQMDWNSTDSIETYNVTWKYDLWTVGGITNSVATDA